MTPGTIQNGSVLLNLLGGAILLALAAAKGEAAMSVTHQPYGETPRGEKVELFTLTNDHGMTIKLMNYGATVTELHVPDKGGQSGDVVLGVKDLATYMKGTRFMGAIVGRYGNRIAGAQFELDGNTYSLPANSGPNTLHGGPEGYFNVVWQGEAVQEAERVGVRFMYVSPDGDQGFPGQLTARVTYWLNDKNEMQIEYRATTNAPTVVNLTHHGYWNLAGDGKASILGHQLTLNAPFFLPVDATAIPTGEMRPVAGTPFDFTQPAAIGARIDTADDQQIAFGSGYDHCFVLNKRRVGELTLAARVSEPTSGRAMEVWTTEPGIQFYSGNKIDVTLEGKTGATYKLRSGFCLETQHFPDSPNKAQFPSTVLRPGEEYRSETIYKFLVE